SPGARDAFRTTLDTIARLGGGDVGGAIAGLSSSGASDALADLQLAAGQTDDALATARTLLARTPGDPRATRVLVLALLAQPQRPDATLDEACSAAAALDARTARPGLREFLDGRLLLARGDARGAVPLLRTAAGSLGDDPLAVLSFGEAL